MVSGFHEWILSAWIWDGTLGWKHIIFAAPLLFVLLRIMLGMRRFKALVFSLTSLLVAKAVFTIYVVVVAMRIFPESSTYAPSQLNACLYVALIYAVLQSCFFGVVRFWRRMNLQAVIIIVFISNMLSALLVYKFLPNT